MSPSREKLFKPSGPGASLRFLKHEAARNIATSGIVVYYRLLTTVYYEHGWREAL